MGLLTDRAKALYTLDQVAEERDARLAIRNAQALRERCNFIGRGTPGSELCAPPYPRPDARLGCVHLHARRTQRVLRHVHARRRTTGGIQVVHLPVERVPLLPAKEWAETKATLPEDVFRQEYMAEFLEDSAGVFRGVDGCLAKTLLNLLGINKRSYSNPWTILNDIPKPDFLVHILWPKWPCAALLWTCAVHTTATSCQKETMFVQVT